MTFFPLAEPVGIISMLEKVTRIKFGALRSLYEVS
jgi:hypothetical protein